MSLDAATVRIALQGQSPIVLATPGPYVIGRGEDASIIVEDRRVSRRHCRAERRDDGWWLVDTSTNGVYAEDGGHVDQVRLDRSRRFHLGVHGGPVLAVEVTDGAGPGAGPAAVEGEPEPPPPATDALRPWYVTAVGESSDRAADPAVGLLPPGLPRPGLPPPGAVPPPVLPGHLRPAAIAVSHLSVRTDDGKVLVEDVSLEARHGTLTAVLGPTGAGKSTLLKALTGSWIPASGAVVVDGVDLYSSFESLRLDIGYVPQDDIVHQDLTIHEALLFGAELRLPDDTPSSVREQVVARVCAELGLTDHVEKRIRSLSGGQRKRVSVALELLTQPKLLVLDEPTSGLDPGYEEALMQLFRRLADGGRTVVVVTHSTSSLGLCDQVVYLGTGGWVAYAGPPDDALAALGAIDHPDAFRRLESPDPTPRSTPEPAPSDLRRPDRVAQTTYPTGTARQLQTLVDRGVRLLTADPRGLGVLAGSALVPAVLLAALVGNGTLSADNAGQSGSPRTLLSGIVIAAGVIGAANGLREIVKELSIYHRERAAGLRRGAYLASKMGVLGAVTAVQAAMLAFVAALLASPGGGNVLPARFELVGIAVLTSLVSLCMGLAISAFVSSSEKALALIPVVFVAFWLFSGTVSDLAGKPVLSQIAYVSPSSWGMAAAASSADLPTLERCVADEMPAEAADVAVRRCDSRWGHTFLQWAFDLFMLLVLGVIAFLATDWALARKELLPHLRREHLLSMARRRVVTLLSGG